MQKFKEQLKMYKAYKKDGKPLGYLQVENEWKIKNNYLNGVSCIVVNKETGEVLFERRQNKGITPGKIDLVSGHVDNDEIGFQAVIRELGEEVGISEEEARNVKKLGKLPLSFESKGEFRNFFTEFFCLIRQSKEIVFSKSEVEEIFWLPMEEAFEMMRSGKTKFPKEENENYESIFQKVREIYQGKNEQQQSRN